MKRLVFTLILFPLACAFGLWAVSFPKSSVSIPQSPLTDPAIQKLVEFLSKNGTSGALLVARENKIAEELYWSWPGKEVTNETLFDLGSLAKQFTGFLILQLEMENKLSVQSRVQEILPETKGTQLGSLVIEDLLHMTSGLPHNEHWRVKLKSQLLQKNWSSSEVLNEILNFPPTFEAGQRIQYSNLGYIIAGQIISRVEGKSFETVLKERILVPLELNHTYLQIGGQQSENLARGHLLVRDRWLPVPAWTYSFLQGAGGIVSNVRDLWKWNQSLESFFLKHPHLASRYYGLHTKFHYGYGWDVRPDMVVHGAVSPGFCAYVAKNERSLAILTLNSDFCEGGGNLQDSMNELANAVVQAN